MSGSGIAPRGCAAGRLAGSSRPQLSVGRSERRLVLVGAVPAHVAPHQVEQAPGARYPSLLADPAERQPGGQGHAEALHGRLIRLRCCHIADHTVTGLCWHRSLRYCWHMSTDAKGIKPLIRDSKGDLLRARTFSATSIHTPKPEDINRTLCGGWVSLTSEWECKGPDQSFRDDSTGQDVRGCREHGMEHGLHQSYLTLCAGPDPQLCKRCERSVARRGHGGQA
jgi:hypothetical protein